MCMLEAGTQVAVLGLPVWLAIRPLHPATLKNIDFCGVYMARFENTAQ